MARAAFSLLILVLAAGDASAQSAAARRAARELLDFLRTRFAREVAEEGAERLEMRFAKISEKWADDAFKAARRVGPRIALDAVDRHGAAGVKILARWGDDGARLLATESTPTLRVFRALGDDGIEMMVRRHGTMTAARLPELAPAIAASGRSRDLLAVLERYGDRACNFLWRNKGVVFTGAVLAAFLANPEPYLNGVKKIVAEPLGHIASATNWTLVFVAATALAAAVALIRMLVLRPARPVAKTADAV
ncbi:MAG TPA: hypothetical protein VK661_11355 [Planctomycetota bacterium]|nr:hypothetical protein [Planctomycetota bacterium]